MSRCAEAVDGGGAFGGTEDDANEGVARAREERWMAARMRPCFCFLLCSIFSCDRSSPSLQWQVRIRMCSTVHWLHARQIPHPRRRLSRIRCCRQLAYAYAPCVRARSDSSAFVVLFSVGSSGSGFCRWYRVLLLLLSCYVWISLTGAECVFVSSLVVEGSRNTSTIVRGSKKVRVRGIDRENNT